MCGICGHVSPSKDKVEAGIIRAMRDTLAHRGPDGGAELEIRPMRADVDLGGWLAHRRLKILDLSELAHQPMANDDGSVVLTYNGEIYNFPELRRELAALGHTVRSTGDTEVVLRAYEAWGEDFLRRLDGMFALAVWDGRVPKLLLARDRPGKKPLFYAASDHGLAFGSEIKALLACPWMRAAPDWSRVAELLTLGYVPDPGTMFEGVRQVPPGSLVVYDEHGLRPPRPYWTALPERLGRRVGGEGHEQIASLLGAATRRRLVADVPLGALLSGGIDSSLVVGLMAQAQAEPIHTFSIGFPDEPSFDERAYARGVADHFATKHTEFSVSVDAVGLLDRLLWHHDQPYSDTSAIPTYLVCQLAREHVTVALNGDGGDEVFAGYDRFKAAALSRRMPGAVVATATAATRLLPSNRGYYDVRRRVRRFLADAEAPVGVRYARWASVLSEDLVGTLLRPEQHATSRPANAAIEQRYRQAEHLPKLDQILFANFTTYLPGDLTVKMDRMSMAHSLETRSPMLDTALIELMAQVPARQKIGLRHPKPLLRAAFGPLLPDWVWQRRKHGFGVPIGRWFAGELGTVFEDEVLGHDARTTDVLVRRAVLDLWGEHRAGVADHGQGLWTILNLERWLRSLERGPMLAPPADPLLDAAPLSPDA